MFILLSYAEPMVYTAAYLLFLVLILLLSWAQPMTAATREADINQTPKPKSIIKLGDGGRGGNADGPGNIGSRGGNGGKYYLSESMRDQVEILPGQPGSDGIGTNGGQGGKGGDAGQVVWLPG